MIQHWPNGVDVLFNPADNSLPAGEMEAAIKYACWSIRERTGIDLRYAGIDARKVEKLEDLRISGKIVFMIALQKDYPEFYVEFDIYNHGFTSKAQWPDQPYDSAVIGIFQHWLASPLSRRNKCTIVHELEHACGMPHIDHERAVIRRQYTGLYPESYGLIGADFLLIQRGGNQTFVELTMEYDLTIPCLQGKVVDLEYVGDGTIHQWKLRRLSEAGQPQIESAAICEDLRQPNLVLTDVRSPTMRLARVELEYDLNKEVWTLAHAE